MQKKITNCTMSDDIQKEFFEAVQNKDLMKIESLLDAVKAEYDTSHYNYNQRRYLRQMREAGIDTTPMEDPSIPSKVMKNYLYDQRAKQRSASQN